VVEGIGDAGAQVLVTGRGTQPRDIEVRALRIAPTPLEHRRQQSLALRVMDEFRLEFPEQAGERVDGHRKLRQLRLARREAALSRLRANSTSARDSGVGE